VGEDHIQDLAIAKQPVISIDLLPTSYAIKRYAMSVSGRAYTRFILLGDNYLSCMQRLTKKVPPFLKVLQRYKMKMKLQKRTWRNLKRNFFTLCLWRLYVSGDLLLDVLLFVHVHLLFC